MNLVLTVLVCILVARIKVNFEPCVNIATYLTNLRNPIYPCNSHFTSKMAWRAVAL